MNATHSIQRMTLAFWFLLLAALPSAAPAVSGESQRRPILILYAFDAEGKLLGSKMAVEKTDTLLGRAVQAGLLEGMDVILSESGIAMTNAAMTTQKLIDTYHPRIVIFTGIAGAIDSLMQIGDIVVCHQWVTHDYGYTGKEGFQPEAIQAYVGNRDSILPVDRFPVDSALLVAAQSIAASGPQLEKIGDRAPKLLVGGTGVSGNAFIDSREKRAWLSQKFSALVTDMESAAVAQVCAANSLPFIVFRSASDLAGGSGSETAGGELQRFFAVAADNSSRVVIEFLSELK